MSDKNLIDALQQIVFKEIAGHLKCQIGNISVTTRLDDLGIDSLGAITILYELEDKLDIEVPNEVFDSLQTVGDILTQIERIIAQKAPV
jgi:acyl carrier protein